MAGLAKITVTRGNGNLIPEAANNDGESLLVIGALSTPPDSVPAWEAVIPGVYKSYQEFATKCAAYPDSVTRFPIFQHVRHFFLNANGQKLHLLPVKYAKGVADMLNTADAEYTKILNYIKNQNGSIKLVGLVSNLVTNITFTSDSVDPATSTMVTRGQALATLLAGLGMPVHILVGALPNFVFNTIPDMRALASPRVSVHVFRHHGQVTAFGTELGTLSLNEEKVKTNLVHTGYVLGKLAGMAVQENIGKVSAGAITDKLAEPLDNPLSSITTNAGAFDNYTDKGYILPVKHPGKSGWFFNDDPTAVTLTDDFAWISRNRVLNKAETIARQVYTERLNDEVDTAPSGLIDPVAAKGLEQLVEAALVKQMVQKGECQAVQVFVDPNQNVVTTSTVNVVIAVQPKGVSRYINVLVKFTQTITA